MAWVRQRSRQGEHALLREGEPLQPAVVASRCCCLNCAIFSGLHEPPYTEPFVRWCGRTAAVTPPPTRSSRNRLRRNPGENEEAARIPRAREYAAQLIYHCEIDAPRLRLIFLVGHRIGDHQRQDVASRGYFAQSQLAHFRYGTIATSFNWLFGSLE